MERLVRVAWTVTFLVLGLGCILCGAETVGDHAPLADENTPVLDTNAIHFVYLDGDFEQAIDLLERAIREKRLRRHADSVFAFKHLGVMYAAKEGTREKGKYFMLQLLSVEPTAKILDMYASDMIYMIFRNVKEEFEARHTTAELASPTRPQRPVPDSASISASGPAAPAAIGSDSAATMAVGPDSSSALLATTPPASGTGPAHTAEIAGKVPADAMDGNRSGARATKVYWYAGAGAALAVGVGVATYFLTSESAPRKTVYEVQ